ncbi:hypothetical protein H4R19_005074 [Coemansia spiralis]|nr:hypothetical protein H4R19_005074 [Coemansia spiralis]
MAARAAGRVHRLAGLPLVRDMDASPATVREALYWPLGRSRLQHAPRTLMYGALAGPDDFPEPPHTFRWTGAGMPLHVCHTAYRSSFATPDQQQWSAGLRVPGASMVHFLGPNLGFRSASGGGPLDAHPGVAAMVLDDVMARVSFANAPDKPAFTANLQLDYLRPLRTACAIVANAWVTGIDGRKTFISAHVADAHDGELLVQARALFVCAA